MGGNSRVNMSERCWSTYELVRVCPCLCASLSFLGIIRKEAVDLIIFHTVYHAVRFGSYFMKTLASLLPLFGLLGWLLKRC